MSTPPTAITPAQPLTIIQRRGDPAHEALLLRMGLRRRPARNGDRGTSDTIWLPPLTRAVRKLREERREGRTA